MTDVFHYGLFNRDTGRCLCTEESPAEKEPEFSFDGKSYSRKLGKFNPDDVYLDENDAVQTRTPFPLELPKKITRHVGETFTIMGIPAGTTVTVEGVLQETEVTDGEIEFGFTTPGTYRVYLQHRAHHMTIMTVVCDD